MYTLHAHLQLATLAIARAQVQVNRVDYILTPQRRQKRNLVLEHVTGTKHKTRHTHLLVGGAQ